VRENVLTVIPMKQAGPKHGADLREKLNDIHFEFDVPDCSGLQVPRIGFINAKAQEEEERKPGVS
jgi:hypothetical protein